MALTACGGGRTSGDVSKACISANRNNASTRLCSCVQQAANQTLNGSDKRRAAAFFEEPHLAQETRQSTNSGSERFWLRYKDFSETAERMCS